MEGSVAGRIVLQLVLIAINAVFACAEIAVVSTNSVELEKREEEGDGRARVLRKLTRVPARFLATIQVAITLSGFLGSAFAADGFAPLMVSAFASIHINISPSVAIILVTILISYLTLIFGELVPKRLAMKNPEKVSLGMAKMLYGVSIIFYPLVALCTVSTNGILRLLGVDPNEDENQVTEEQIRMLVDAGNEKDVTILYTDDSMEEWKELIHKSRHTHFPVCRDTADHVIGVLDAKDFFRLYGTCSKDEMLARAVDPAYFVPGTVRADVLFQHMKKSGHYFAVVLDEYGGMDGIISLKDLMEQLVGDLVEDDEVARPEEIVKISDTMWRIQGSASLDDVADELDVDLPVDEYDTFSGYIFGVLGSVPDDGSRFELDSDGLHIRVFKVKDHMVEGAIVTKVVKKAEDEQILAK